MNILGRLPQRIVEKISPEPNSGCYLWIGAIDACGYGRIGFGGINAQAPRVVYELINGAIAPGLELDHLCRTRSCVNPLHLEAVPHRENVLRGYNPNKAKTHCKHGHPLDDENTYRYQAGKRKSWWRACRTCKELRKKGLL